MLVQLLRQVGDDSPQSHHLLVIVRIHYRHYAESDFGQKASSPKREWRAKRRLWPVLAKDLEASGEVGGRSLPCDLDRTSDNLLPR